MIMTQGNTCTYINGLTNNKKKWRLYFEFRLKIITLNKKIKTKTKTTNNYICSIPVARGCKVTSYYLNSPLPKKNKHKIKTTVINENVYSIQIATCA